MFDTLVPAGASVMDSALYVRSFVSNVACNGTELGCNDNNGAVLQSRVQLNLTAGPSVIVVIDTAGSATPGGFVLNIHSAPAERVLYP